VSRLVEVDPAELDQRLGAASDELLVLYLWGPDCPNCVSFKRSLPALLDSLADVKFTFLALDVYEFPEVARRYAVYGIPHFLLFKAGKRLGKMSEFRGEQFWAAVVREHAEAPAPRAFDAPGQK
jgi:thioredoxin 1